MPVVRRTAVIVAHALLVVVLTVVASAQAPAQRGGSAPPPAAGGVPARNPEVVPLAIKLPFPAGARYKVLQGNGGAFSHNRLNHYAWDFSIPEGMPVCAAADGRVVRVKDDSTAGGVGSEFLTKANAIIIDHGNGYFTQYLHLRMGSARVTEGETVKGGQVIGLSGNTGFSSTPHLHFDVQDALGQSLPAAFLDLPGTGVPGQGDVCVSGNDGRGVASYEGESRIPSDAFRRNGVLITSTDLPAHLLRSDRGYSVQGRVLAPAAEVAVFVMGPEGGWPLAMVTVPVRHGVFSAKLDLSALPQRAKSWSSDPGLSNPFTLAIAPVRTDGSYWSEFSVAVCVR